MRDIIVIKADKFAHEVYRVSRLFPKEEIYGLTSQLRRSVLSVVLNVIEGFARNRNLEYLHFLEIAYGSLKESKYLLHFCYKEDILTKKDYTVLISIAEEIGKMI